MDRQVLTLADFQKVSQLVSDRIRTRIEAKTKAKLSVTPVQITFRKALNEAVFLVVAKEQTLKELKIFGFIVLVSLEAYMTDQPVSKSVHVHQLLTEEFESTKSSKYGLIKSDLLPFEPRTISLNLAESAVMLTGQKGVLIGHLPGTIEAMINHKEQDLQMPASDPDITLLNCT